MPETFSVITINFNNITGLRRTVESVWAQTVRKEIEFIVVDGNSTDGSVKFLQENIAGINQLIIEKDRGIYDAMNKGLKAATGKYVWFVNSGDAIYDPHVAENLFLLSQTAPDVMFGDTMFIEPDGVEIGPISRLKPQSLPEKLNPASFRFGMSVCHQSFLVKRELCPQYSLEYKQAADIDWIIQILQNKPTTAKFDGIISSFEVGGSSYQNEKKAWKERYGVLRKHYGTTPNFLAHIWIAFRRFLFKIGVWKP